ncbi:hypothetical protein ACKKBF_B03755 [Auxenochlorella protothecoides x Auxenochlorella symbiontica]
MREPDQIPGVTRPTRLQLPVSQHFTNARLEQAYRQYIGTIQLGNDVAMTRLMMAYQAVATYKTLKEAHEMDWMTMLMICNFAVLGATLLLPSVWPGVWRRWRDVIMPPLLVSHTAALHIFLYSHSTSESLLGRGTLSRLIDQCAGGTDALASQALVFQRSLTSRFIPAQAIGYMMLASYNWHQGHVETLALYTLHTVLGLILPCIIAWQAEYKARFSFLREAAKAQPIRLPPLTLLARLSCLWLLPVFLLESLTGPMFICHSMLKTGYSWWAIYSLMLIWSGAVVLYNSYFYILA